MAAVPLDTLKMAERLERAGFSIEQAKLQAAMLAEIIGAEDASIVERFPGKHDVSRELTGIGSSIEKLDAKTDRTAAEAKASLSGAKAELVRWVVGVGLLQMAFIAGLVLKLVPGYPTQQNASLMRLARTFPKRRLAEALPDQPGSCAPCACGAVRRCRLRAVAPSTSKPSPSMA